MKPPTSVKVGTSLYSVNVVDEFPRGEDYQGHYGMTNVVSEEIYVSSKQGAGQMLDTVCHEVMHAIINRAGLRLSDEDEEKMISQLVPWLLVVLQDNPKLVAYLTEKVK